MDKDLDLKQSLAEALGPDYSEMIVSYATQIEPYQSLSKYEAFRFGHYEIYLISTNYYQLSKFVYMVVAFASGKSVYLVDEPRQYMELAKVEHVWLDQPEQAIRYVQTYLDYTKDHYDISYLVASVDELRLSFDSHQPEEPQRQRQAEVKDRLGSIITLPEAQETEEGYQVKTFSVYQRELDQWEVHVSRSGEILEQAKIRFEEDLPLVYVIRP